MYDFGVFFIREILNIPEYRALDMLDLRRLALECHEEGISKLSTLNANA